MLQGEFKRWTDSSLLKMTLWYDPLKSMIVNLTTHVLDKDYLYWTAIVGVVVVNTKQPEISHSKNCTAVITQHSLHLFPWLVIDCDALYEATYVCQDNKPSVHPVVRKTFNHTCDGDWYMIIGSNKCFSVSLPHSAMSFYDAQDICFTKNASIFTVDVMTRNTSQKDLKALKYAIGHHFLHKIHDSNLRVNLQDVLFGKLMYFYSPHIRLIHGLSWFDNAYGIRRGFSRIFFARVNNSCNIVERSTTNIFDTGTVNQIRRGWGVKCRSCSQPLNITGVICEKESIPYTISCQSHQFKCEDETCVLYIYRCDLAVDCVDGSDEDNCMTYISNFTNQYLDVPYLIQGIFETPIVNVIQIHAICDGIYSNETFTIEKEVCFNYTLKNIDVLSAKQPDLTDKKYVEIVGGEFVDLYKKEVRMVYKSQACTKLEEKFTAHREQVTMSFNVTNANDGKKCFKMSEYCIVGVNINRCRPTSDVCVYFSCPGMFKCHKSYCIYMSSVCDDQYDCEEGEDEIFCPLSSCPGMLKCRGEIRCISKEEICDNYVNCLYSMDDEIGCHECPYICQCDGYSMLCHLENTLHEIASNHVSYVKGLILKGFQHKLVLYNIFFPRIVYLNASFCGIKTIIHPDEIHPDEMRHDSSQLLIASFIHNDLTEVTFLGAIIFKNVVYLDLSFNHVSNIRRKEYFTLNNLIILSVKGNPLKSIDLSKSHFSIMPSLVDLRYIDYSSGLSITFPETLSKNLHVEVSDLMICCLLHSNIKCTFNKQTKKCNGLIESVVKKVSFYSTSSISLCISLIVFIRHISQILSPDVANSKKKYYWILYLNNSVATILIPLHLLSILTADAVKVSILYWTSSPICLFLILLIYISLQAMTIFKLCIVLFLSSHILYPFKHQCRFFKWTILFSFVIWFLISISSLIMFLGKLQPNYLCTIVRCANNDQINLLLILSSSTYSLSMLVCIAVLLKTYKTLATQNKKMCIIQTTRRLTPNMIVLVLKLARPYIYEFPFRMCLIAMQSMNLENDVFGRFCQSVVLFYLPGNVIFSYLLLVIFK